MSDAPVKSTLDIQLLVGAAGQNTRKRGLEEDVTELFEQWRGALLRYLSAVGLSQHDSEEIVQEVFLSLFCHLRKEKARTNLRGWLFRVAHNLALKRRIADRNAGWPRISTACRILL